MLFYKITAQLLPEEPCDTPTERSEQRSRNAALALASETFWQRQRQEVFVFVTNIHRQRISFGAILKTRRDIAAVFADYQAAASLALCDVRFEETTLHTLKEFLEKADHFDFIDDADTVFEGFGLDSLCGYNLMRRFAENMLEDNVKKADLLRTADRLLSTESLAPEIERIYRGAAKPGAMGHPVHYLLQCDDQDSRRDLYRTLLTALYNNGRLQTRRYAFFNLEEDSSFSERDFELLYKGFEGSAVVIRYCFGDECTDSEYATPGGEELAILCELAQKYRQSVLTVFCLPTGAPKLKQALLENLTALALVELHEDVVFGERAHAYLRTLAKGQHLRPDAALYRIVQEERGYGADELRHAFTRWQDNKLRQSIYPQYADAATVYSIQRRQKPRGAAIDELESMVGLDEAKAVIHRALNFYKAQKLFKDRRPIGTPAMHMVFTGNPGTAKTTVARLFAQTMKDNGLLEKGDLYEVGRADLVGKYVGWTAQMVKAKFKAARGSVLFIDEAYALVDDRDGMFGDEAINTIVQEMENNRDNMVVIFAGYPDKMEQFLQKNPGLRSRIAFHVPFPDYSTDELCDIAALMAKKRGLALDEQAAARLREVCAVARLHPDFGNGRFVRNLLEQAEMAQMERLLALDCDHVSDTALGTLCAEDLQPPVLEAPELPRVIGFG